MKQSWAIGIIISVCCLVALALAGMYGPALLGGDVRETPRGAVSAADKNSSGTPPEEAVAACLGKSTGAVCQFSDRGATRSGTCDIKPGVLACAPEREQGTGSVASDAPGSMTTRATQKAVPTSVTPTAQSVKTTQTPGFTLVSDAGTDGSALPALYSCDGSGLTPALSWSGAPAGTSEYALMVTTLPVDGSTRWNWVLYSIPGTVTALARNSAGVGITGTGSHGTVMQYDPPCPQGPGAKTYTFTLYALSASPSLPSDPAEVTGEILTRAIQPVTLAKTSFNLSYARNG